MRDTKKFSAAALPQIRNHPFSFWGKEWVIQVCGRWPCWESDIGHKYLFKVTGNWTTYKGK